MKKEVTYQIIKNVLVLHTTEKGWTKEVNLISWNDKDPVIDIRMWSPDKSVIGKGVTMTKEEFESLLECDVEEIFKDEIGDE